MAERKRPTTIAGVADMLEEVDAKVTKVCEGLHTNNRLRNLALVTAFLCLVAAGFSTGYAVRASEQVDTAEAALENQIDTNRRVVCSTARSTALAFREPAISSDGTKETRQHFIARMLAQRATLTAAVPLRCSGIPGFATFPYLRARALHEIEVILNEEAPQRFGPPKDRPLAGPNTTSASPDESVGNPASEGVDLPAADPPAAEPGGGVGDGRTPETPQGEEDVPESGAPPAPGTGGGAGGIVTTPTEPTSPSTEDVPGPTVTEKVGKALCETTAKVGVRLCP